jgi:hypothetical protein
VSTSLKRFEIVTKTNNELINCPWGSSRPRVCPRRPPTSIFTAVNVELPGFYLTADNQTSNVTVGATVGNNSLLFENTSAIYRTLVGSIAIISYDTRFGDGGKIDAQVDVVFRHSVYTKVTESAYMFLAITLSKIFSD